MAAARSAQVRALLYPQAALLKGAAIRCASHVGIPRFCTVHLGKEKSRPFEKPYEDSMLWKLPKIYTYKKEI